jgi:fumarylacetoacetate (FAA) hydrolase
MVKVATVDNATRDGQLVVVSQDNKYYVVANNVAPNLQSALDQWDAQLPKIQEIYNKLNAGELDSEKKQVDEQKLRAPLPRSYEWIDGSAYINHVVLVRKARNAEPPKTLKTDPLVYQGLILLHVNY